METRTTTSIPLQTRTVTRLADLHTPVSAYLKLRDRYREPVLLESNDAQDPENCHSFLGLDPLAAFQVKAGTCRIEWPGGRVERFSLENPRTVPDRLQDFVRRFAPSARDSCFNGLFGHVSFDGLQYFDTLAFDPAKRRIDLPDLRFSLYRFILIFDPFRDALTLRENRLPGEPSRLEEVLRCLDAQRLPAFPFRRVGERCSNLSDAEFKKLVEVGKRHCQRGDVFQIVFSRQFAQAFEGDEFQVYRVLRSINPSPYLFYFDYGNYKIFGSSPEAQMVMREGVAQVNPIAGTYRRSGDRLQDAEKARELAADSKERAEHIMLVDLARNDLSRHAQGVQVRQLKDIQYFSHVIHLVSRVEGELLPGTNPVRVFADTFPAGTLSGAPKYKALQLIDRYENQNRGPYGGSIGFIDFEGNINQAIVIRSFLSYRQTLLSQAGAGIVVDSDPEKELQEVNNKLGALQKALEQAEEFCRQSSVAGRPFATNGGKQ